MTDTILIAIIVGLIVIVAIVLWTLYKTKRQTKVDADGKITQLDLDLDFEEDEKSGPNARISAWVHEVAPNPEPPVYNVIAKERERAATIRQAGQGVPLYGAEGLTQNPIDPVVQWKLSVEGEEDHPISIGQMALLCDRLERDLADTPYEAWALSTHDDKYYPLSTVSHAAKAVIVGVSFANRRYFLTQEKASFIKNVVESLASEEYAPLELSVELCDVEEMAKRVQQYVRHFKSDLRVYLIPREAPITEATIESIAEKAQLKPIGRAFGYWSHTRFKDPAFILNPLDGLEGAWEMIFDAQLANVKRGELKRFFTVMNHIAALVGAKCHSTAGRPLMLAEILHLEKLLLEHQNVMVDLNIDPGSPRAYKLFANQI